MCGHGAIGVAVTLCRIGKIGLGVHFFETPVGVVSVTLKDRNEATIANVPSYRYRKSVPVEVDGFGKIVGDIAWGGNWFFIINDFPVPLTRESHAKLTSASLAVLDALRSQGITGENGAEIDHIEFSSRSDIDGVDSVNFVMCPGGEYDRSPCGTGTSAKLACLAADGKLAEGELWTQNSSAGGQFVASFRYIENRPDGSPVVAPQITGKAFVCSESTLIVEANDPFGFGMVRKEEESQ
jgi:4-hydroxyproline epimerase